MTSRRLLLAASTFMACCSLCQAGTAAEPYRAPRTSFGAPDLEGVWTNQTATRLERPGDYKGLNATDAELKARAGRLAAAKARGDRPKVQSAAQDAEDGDVGQGESEFVDRTSDLMLVGGRRRTSVVTDPADGQLPYTEAGRRLAARAQAPRYRGYDNPEDRSASERCLASPSQAGPPMLSGPDDANFQIVQTPDRVGILSEMIHDLRIVRLGGVHPQAHAHPVQGDAVGWWEGDTLVIETADQSPLTTVREVDGSILWLSPDAKVTERFRRVSPTEILYDFTVEDRSIYTRPWSGEMILRRVEAPIYEYACHEGNYALRNVLTGAREKERRAASSGPSAGPAAPLVRGNGGEPGAD